LNAYSKNEGKREELPRLDVLPLRGNYSLIILLETSSRVGAQSYDWPMLRKGYYAYTGSAVGKGAVSLRQRVARHLRKKKIKHWHIDHLLTCPGARVTAVVACASKINRECKINKVIQNIRGANVPIKGFGASDCQQNCASHLVYLGKEDVFDAIINVYRGLSTRVKAVRVS
jgi:Uri superfamily endonuclease